MPYSTLYRYPAGKFLFFKPDTMSVKGKVPLHGVGMRKEELLEPWKHIDDIGVHELERCNAVDLIPNGFEVKSQSEKDHSLRRYRARRVILAIGGSGSPMKLGVPGEDLKIESKDGGASVGKVKYALSDPDDYRDWKCMVVGAGNSAIETALALSGFTREGDQISFTTNNEVTLVIRSHFKGDLKLANKMDIYDCMDAGRVTVLFRKTIKEIKEREVVLADARSGEETTRMANDFIFALVGSEHPTRFLEQLGIQIDGDRKGGGRTSSPPSNK